jgi:endonuclease/exonuclease/phosphatase family metal-dependent hydrolase
VTGRSVDPDRLAREFPGYHIVIRGELVTLSRLPIVSTVALPVDPPAGSDWRTDYWEVKTLRTDLRVGDGVLSVYNVHMLVPLDLVSPLKRSFWRTREEWNARRQNQYAGLEHDLDANRNPTVVAGDFNTSPSMGDRNGVASRLNDAGRASTSVYPTSWKSDWLALWRVDWAFTNDGVDVHTYKLVPHNDMSDHRLQDMTVSLKASR